MVVTFNYAPLSYAATDGPGFRKLLHDQRGRDVLPNLSALQAQLGEAQGSDDYWEAAPGVAGRIIAALVVMGVR